MEKPRFPSFLWPSLISDTLNCVCSIFMALIIRPLKMCEIKAISCKTIDYQMHQQMIQRRKMCSQFIYWVLVRWIESIRNIILFKINSFSGHRNNCCSSFFFGNSERSGSLHSGKGSFDSSQWYKYTHVQQNCTRNFLLDIIHSARPVGNNIGRDIYTRY